MKLLQTLSLMESEIRRSKNWFQSSNKRKQREQIQNQEGLSLDKDEALKLEEKEVLREKVSLKIRNLRSLSRRFLEMLCKINLKTQ